MVRICFALFAVLMTSTAFTAHAGETVEFRYGGESFKTESLPTAYRQKLFEIEVKLNEQREQIFAQFAIERYVAERAEAEGKRVQDMQVELLGLEPPNEAALRQFYDENKEQIPAEFEQVRGQIAQYVQQQQLQQGLAMLLDRVRSEKGFEVTLPQPVAPVFDVATEGYPAKGSKEALVTVVEFADFQCPYCKQATGAVDNLLERYGDRVRVVYRDFPINQSGISREISKGGICAEEQGNFWPYHDLAFENQASLTAESPAELAAEVGLDETEFAACLIRGDTDARIENSKADAIGLGVSGTPAFFVNGRKLHVDGEIERSLIDAIEKALSERS